MEDEIQNMQNMHNLQKVDSAAATTPISLENLENDFGCETDELIALFCDGASVELEKVKAAAEAENLERLLHNARGLRAVCESVYVRDMGKTCSEIEQAGTNSQWSQVKVLIERLEAEFSLVQLHHQK